MRRCHSQSTHHRHDHFDWLEKDGDEFSGGKILDPGNGKLYSCKLTLTDKSKTLNVRGYIGVPWLGRSQVWHREP